MNIFTSFLSLLKVKHTKYFSTKLYNEHPYKYTLYGISCMLEEYKIQTMGLQIDDKDELQLLETPFIAQVSNDFVLVTDLHRQNIKYIWREKKITTTIEKFKNLWSGVVLLAESKADSIEPNYSQNLKQELFSRIEKYILLIIILFVSCGAFINSFDFSLCQRIFLIITSSTGLYVCYLLLLKQLRINSSSADKICSLFNKSDCNDVLESPAARLMGVVGWSEVGFSYFLGNLLILLFFYDFIYYLTIINIVVLPYSLWSIWYQRYRAKQWCPLCIIVQVLLWLLFLINIALGTRFNIELITLNSLFIVVSIYLFPLLSVNLLLPVITDALKFTNITQEINSLKMKDEVFLALLKQQSFYRVDSSVSSIKWGNKGSKILITIITNPHCNPCAKIHRRVKKLLETIGDKVCVQYIFTSFNDDLESSGRFLTALYLQNSANADYVEKCFDEWFESGKSDREKFFIKYGSGIDLQLTEQEYNNHILWRKFAKIKATPTILINGCELPDNYIIEDISNFMDLEIATPNNLY